MPNTKKNNTRAKHAYTQNHVVKFGSAIANSTESHKRTIKAAIVKTIPLVTLLLECRHVTLHCVSVFSIWKISMDVLYRKSGIMDVACQKPQS